MSKPMPKPREPKAPGPCIDTTPDKAIDAIRASAVVEPAAIPEPPATFRGAPIGTRNQFIEWVAEPDRAELSHAADELQENPAQLADDLGRRAPDVTTVSELQERVRTSGSSLARLEALIQATKQQHEVALSDLSRIVRRVAERVQFDGDDDPALARRYPLTIAYASRRGEIIAEGMERARRQREAKAASDKPAQPKA
ncbi:MAG: hypothetical protein R3A52_03015 [Polyangiales bacterium]